MAESKGFDSRLKTPEILTFVDCLLHSLLLGAEGVTTGIIARLRGRRPDSDGWWARARRAQHPNLTAINRPDIGFSEESAITVQSRALALLVDAWSARGARS